VSLSSSSGQGFGRPFENTTTNRNRRRISIGTIVADNLGFDQKQPQASTFLLSGSMAEELDITELFREVEEEFGIDLPDSETQGAETVGQLWELVERKISSPIASSPIR
jgi:acyl carrier protein